MVRTPAGGSVELLAVPISVAQQTESGGMEARSNLKELCAHDVAAACRLAMADVWVRLPLGALVDSDLLIMKAMAFGWHAGSFFQKSRILGCQPGDGGSSPLRAAGSTGPFV